MPTSLHLPDDLLSMVDQRAKALRVSRNRFIVDTLRSVLQDPESWSPGFIAALEQPSPGLAGAVDDLERNIIQRRKSKSSVDLTPPRTKRKRKATSR